MRHFLWPALALGSALCLVAALLPLELRIGVGADGSRWRMRFRVAVPWGLARWSMRTGPQTRAARPAHRRGAEPGDGRHGPGMEERLRIAERLWRTIHVDGVHVTLEAGLGDAAATAVACGVLWALASALVGYLPALAPANARVRVGPVYGAARFRGVVVVRAHMAVWQALWVALALVRPPGKA